MLTVKEHWNPFQKNLKAALALKDFNSAIYNVCKLHSLVHTSSVGGNCKPTFQDEILSSINYDKYRLITSRKYGGRRTIAFFIYHMTRIEDICANILIANDKQVILQSGWKDAMNISRIDTGNAMTKKEIIDFSEHIDILNLFEYRKAVGVKTQEIIKNLELSILYTKPSKKQLDRILQEDSVQLHPDSIWLIDNWSKKNIGGLLMMPLTRHQIIHLNDCRSILNSCG